MVFQVKEEFPCFPSFRQLMMAMKRLLLRKVSTQEYIYSLFYLYNCISKFLVAGFYLVFVEDLLNTYFQVVEVAILNNYSFVFTEEPTSQPSKPERDKSSSSHSRAKSRSRSRYECMYLLRKVSLACIYASYYVRIHRIRSYYPFYISLGQTVRFSDAQFIQPTLKCSFPSSYSISLYKCF